MNRPHYFPMRHGQYDVSAGLRPLGTDFGGGKFDACVFQFDDAFSDYRRVKLEARAERLEKYVPIPVDFSPEVEARVCLEIRRRLVSEWPDWFQEEGGALHCRLTGEVLAFSEAGFLDVDRSTIHARPLYRSAFDALACQVQEDLAVWRLDGDREWLGAIHLCFPNHWAAESKIGRGFVEVHRPVKGAEKLMKGSHALVEMMVRKGPFVRFAWGVSTDTRLNHHPEPPPSIAPGDWHGRSFDPNEPSLFARVERQTLLPFSDVGASLFTIRTYFEPVNEFEARGGPSPRSLIAAIQSMTSEQLEYKGLSASRDAVIGYLESLV